MSKTIANFLVGIGLDTKDFEKGSRKVDTSLGGFRSKAGIAGGAIAAAFSAAGLAAINAGNRADEFMRRVERLNAAPRFINNLEYAFKKMGGQAGEAISAVEKAEEVLMNLKKGDASTFEEIAKAGVNPASLQNSQDGEDFIRRLTILMPDLNKWQQQSIQQTLGLSNAGLKTLNQGTDRMNELIAEGDKYAQNLEKAAAAGREYNEVLVKLGAQFDDIGNILADKILPQFSSLLNNFSKFLEGSMPKVEAAANFVADNVGSVSAIGAGLGVAGVAGAGAGVASKLGMGKLATVGRLTATGGAIGAAAGVGSLLWDTKASDIKDMTGYDVSKYYKAPSETWQDIKGWWGNRKGAPVHDVNPNEKPPEWMSAPKEEPAKIGSPYADSTVPNELANTDKTTPPRDWWRDGAVSPADAASASPVAIQAGQSKPTLSQLARSDASIPQPIVIDNRVTLNGREMAKFVKEVNSEQRFEAVTDIASTVDR